MDDKRNSREGFEKEENNESSTATGSEDPAEEKESDQIGIVTQHDDEKEEKVEQKPIEEIEETQEENRKMKNLISLVIILAGVAIGSLFIDVVQFMSGSGYSERALKESEIFVAGEKTWVAYEDPAIEVQVLSVGDGELAECENCDPTEVLMWLKRFVPTLITKRVDASSAEGEALIEKYDLKSIPSFVFSDAVQDSSFYQGEARVLFAEKEGDFVLNSTGLGIPVGKYLETPTISEGDAVLGNPEAAVKMVVYSDFQCPYCSKYFEQVKQIAEENESVVLIYKDLPLDFHPKAVNAAHAARCAGQQEMFWEVARELYSTQDIWGKQEGKMPFITMATKLGLNRADFTTCIEEETFTEEIEKDMDEAKNFGISGTPATFINGQFLSGVVEQEELNSLIEKELQ
ncbi:MAG: thioredoxin domain-containing protein [Patescibacteria group bacterium]|nr:thioredoxin domain-containing protein [Patescibacteria group bacterium]